MTRRASLLLMAASPAPAAGFPDARALTFDVFGTVVDWRSSLIAELRTFAQQKGLSGDWEKFADAWRDGYAPAMDQVRSGKLAWQTIDQLHRRILEELLIRFRIPTLAEADKDHLNRAWHRLKPWPDSVAGLTRLKRKYIITSLSNGNVSLLVHMAKQAALPWDTVLSAELAGHYKPDREAYLKAAQLLDLRPDQVLMVAAHKSDLEGARRAGLRTAFVTRPLEKGPAVKLDISREPWMDVYARDFLDLAAQAGV